jgi:hypothetical protein
MQVAFGLAGNSPGDVTVQAPANSIVPGLTDWMRVEFNLSDPDANIGLPTNFASFMFPITGGYQYTQFGSRYPNLGKQTVIYNHNRTNNGPGTLWGVDSVSTFRFDTPDGVGTDAAWNNVNWLFDAVRFTASPADSAPYSWGFASTLDNWTAFPFNGFAGTATNSVGKAIISGSGTGNVLFGNWGVAVDTVAARKLVVDLAVARSSGASDVPLRLFFDNDTAGLGTESVSTSIPSQFIDGVQRRYTFDMIAHKNAGSRTWGTNDYLRFVTALAMQLNANGNNIPIIGIESIDLVADAEAPSLSAVERFSPTGASTSSNTVTFMVTLNERVNNIDIGDFTLVTGGGLTGGSVTGVTPLMGINGYSERVQVTVSGYAGSGSLGLVVTPGSNMTDGVGNVVNSAAIPPTNQLYSIDQDGFCNHLHRCKQREPYPGKCDPQPQRHLGRHGVGNRQRHGRAHGHGEQRGGQRHLHHQPCGRHGGRRGRKQRAGCRPERAGERGQCRADDLDWRAGSECGERVGLHRVYHHLWWDKRSYAGLGRCDAQPRGYVGRHHRGGGLGLYHSHRNREQRER